MEVFLAFDVGQKGWGVAVGNRATQTSAALGGWSGVWEAEEGGFSEGARSHLLKLQRRWGAHRGVVGRPLHMDGRSFWMTRCAERFARALGALWGVPIDFQDERLTTVEAKSRLFAQHGRRGLDKSRVDAEAAALILKDYLS